MRHAAASSVVLVLVAALVLAGPGAPAAHALDPGSVPAPTRSLAYPPAVVTGSMDGATEVQRAAAVARTASSSPLQVTGVAQTAKTAGAATRFAGPAGVALTGLGVGWTIGSGIASLFGLDSQGALDQLLGVAPGPGFTPNTDVPPAGGGGRPAGWSGDPQIAVRCCYALRDGSFDYLYGTGTIAISDTGPSSVSLTISAPASPGEPWGTISATAYCAEGAVTRADLERQRTTTGGGFGVSAEPGGAAAQVACPSGRAVAGLVFAGPDGSPLWFYGAPVTDRPAGTAPVVADPARQWETRTICTGGGAPLVTRSEPYRETAPSWPAPEQPAQCAPGLSVEAVEVLEVDPAGTRPARQVIRTEVSQPARDWAAANPQCTTGGCQLDLQRTDPATGARASCFADPRLCLDWQLDPDRATRYQCSYGGNALPLADCRVYVEVFARDPARRQLSDPNPLTQTGPDAPPTQQPAPLPEPFGAPAPEPAVQGTSDECPPPVTLKSFITGRLVYDAAVCALEFAFVPQPATVARVAGLPTRLATVTPFPQLASVFGAFSGAPVDGSCLNYALNGLPEPLPERIPIINTCDASHPVVAAIRPLRALLGAAMWVLFLAPLAWWAWKQYAPGSTGVA